MTIHEGIYYLDTSALVKRYVEEPGTKIIDGVFDDAYKGVKTISFSYWNLGEAVVVFDKYERIIGVDAKRLLRDMLREIKTLAKLHRIIMIGIDPLILRRSINVALKHHIYIADALQIISARESKSTLFITADKQLAHISEIEGLNILLLPTPK